MSADGVLGRAYTGRHRRTLTGRLALAWSRLNCRLAGVTR